jgi:hypothetical protein
MHRTILLALAGAAGVAAVLMAAAGAQAGVMSPPDATTASVAPATTTPGGAATFSVSCATLDAAAATLQGGSLGLPALIPMNAAADEGDFVVTLRLPADTKPGGHRVRIVCSDGTSATVPLRVESARAAAAAAANRAGAIAGPAPATMALAAGGLALMIVGAVSGGIALTRLRSGYRSRAG